MKRVISLALCAVLFALCVSGCVFVDISSLAGGVTGRGNPESYEFKVGEITEVRVEIYCNIDYYAAPSDTVTLKIQPNLRDHIVVEESNGVLTVSPISPRGINWSRIAPVLTVSTLNLEYLSISGAGTITTHDTITADSFALRLDGAGEGRIKLDVDSLFVDVSGAGEYELSGSADRADINMSGAGSLDALQLKTRESKIDLSGVGTVSIDCSEKLRIVAAGVGSVEYRGSPSIEMDKGGLVNVTKVD